MSFIYIISPDNNPNLCKIGLSKNPEKRLKQLQTGNAEKLVLKYTKEIAETKVKTMEKTIHQTLRLYKESGEWFSISVDNAILELEWHFIRYS